MNQACEKRVMRRGLVFCAFTLSISAATCEAGFTVFESGGANPAAITPTRDAFRAAVGGGTVAGANGSFGGIRREINWDGVPDTQADPNGYAPDFFNTTSPRGLVVSTPGTGFLISANASTPSPVLFGFGGDFQTFSAQRLFTAVNSNITDVSFFLPGTTTPATTSAFGAIFVDAEVDGLTKIEFFNASNTLIFSRAAIVAGNQGLSFLGGVANAGEQISRVRLTSGLNTITSNGVLGNPNDDVVVMDDFLYAEPTVVPEPGMLGVAGVLFAGAGMRRRRSAAR